MLYQHSSVKSYSSGRSRGELGGSREPPFETKLFHFHGDFSEKSGKINNQVKLTKQRIPTQYLSECTSCFS